MILKVLVIMLKDFSFIVMLCEHLRRWCFFISKFVVNFTKCWTLFCCKEFLIWILLTDRIFIPNICFNYLKIVQIFRTFSAL